MADNNFFKSPDICVRCSSIYGSCCVTRSCNENRFSFVSDNEADRIADYINEHEGYFAFESNSASFIQMLCSLFPDNIENVGKNFPAGGLHRSLAVDCFGRCLLLGEKGCVLPYGLKPLFCRIYPFWFSGAGLKVFTNSSCLALDESKGVDGLKLFFNICGDTPEQVYSMILTSWFK